METLEARARLNEIAEKVIGCAFRVSNELGAGFLEKVYENALACELKKRGDAGHSRKRWQGSDPSIRVYRR